jgi:hypothetical protein
MATAEEALRVVPSTDDDDASVWSILSRRLAGTPPPPGPRFSFYFVLFLMICVCGGRRARVGLDNLFLLAEQPEHLMAIAGCWRFATPPLHSEVRATFQRLVDTFPRFKQRVPTSLLLFPTHCVCACACARVRVCELTERAR